MTAAVSGPQLAFAAVRAVAQMQAGRAQASAYASQATMARLQAKQEALRYKQQGVQVLDNILRTQATITARAGAGGIDPFSGSAERLSQYALKKGAEETYIIRDNEVIALRGGQMQAQQYMQQAKASMQMGLLGAGLAMTKPFTLTPLGEEPTG